LTIGGGGRYHAGGQVLQGNSCLSYDGARIVSDCARNSSTHNLSLEMAGVEYTEHQRYDCRMANNQSAQVEFTSHDYLRE
jgi:hypothetical protein